MNINPDQNHRILVIDDNKAIHDDFIAKRLTALDVVRWVADRLVDAARSSTP